MQETLELPLELIANKIDEACGKSQKTVVIRCEGSKISLTEVEVLKTLMRKRNYRMDYDCSKQFYAIMVFPQGIYFIPAISEKRAFRIPLPPPHENVINIQLDSIR